MFVIILKFIISVRGSHYDYTPWVPESLVKPLLETTWMMSNVRIMS